MYQRTRDYQHHYRGYHDCSSVCRVETWEQVGSPPLIICTELADNPGTSVTNRCEVLAAQLVATHFPAVFDVLEGVPYHFIERYPPGRYRTARREPLAFVTFAYRVPHAGRGIDHHAQPTLGQPTWTHVRREALEALLGCPYPEPEYVDRWGKPVERDE